MDGENNNEIKLDNKEKDKVNKFGKVIDLLHNKTKLPSLRTYQGDMAEFIKNKDESVVSIVVKEKEKEEREKEKRQTEQIKQKIEVENPAMFPKSKEKSKYSGLQINFTIIILSLFLIISAGTVIFYVIKVLKISPVVEVTLEQDILPYNNLVTLANITKANFGSELSGLRLENGVSVFQISGTDGKLFKKPEDLFDFLEVSLPSILERTLKNEYLVGAISQNEKTFPFIILTVNDFGRAFSAMLEWENNMVEGLAFLNPKKQGADSSIDLKQTASTTETTIPLKPEIFAWKDIIIKNKDTRGLVNSKNQAKIAYTFLDKNTILITGDLTAIGEVSSVYASRSIVR